MRGRGNCPLLKVFKTGITPARAGKSPPGQEGQGPLGDHPRACGEEGWCQVTEKTCWGSPPRVRGRVRKLPLTPSRQGITPARAGKSGSVPGLPAAGEDHPRACGEETTWLTGSTCALGSPPRVRGRAQSRFRLQPPPGITPARAGKRYTPGNGHCRTRDHPRACGEESQVVPVRYVPGGSPPRARGRDSLYLLA